MKFKIIKSADLNHLEAMVNNWFLVDQHIKIVSYSLVTSENYFVLSFIYKEKNDSTGTSKRGHYFTADGAGGSMRGCICRDHPAGSGAGDDSNPGKQ